MLNSFGKNILQVFKEMEKTTVQLYMQSTMASSSSSSAENVLFPA